VRGYTTRRILTPRICTFLSAEEVERFLRQAEDIKLQPGHLLDLFGSPNGKPSLGYDEHVLHPGTSLISPEKDARDILKDNVADGAEDLLKTSIYPIFCAVSSPGS